MNACRMCGHPIAPSAKACPNCGASSPNIGDYRAKTVGSVIGALIVAALLFMAAGSNTGGWKIGLTVAALAFIGGGVYGAYLGMTGKDG